MIITRERAEVHIEWDKKNTDNKTYNADAPKDNNTFRRLRRHLPDYECSDKPQGRNLGIQILKFSS